MKLKLLCLRLRAWGEPGLFKKPITVD